MIESGIPGFNAGVWWALLAPKGTPAQVIQRINTEWGKISKDAEVIEAYARLGVNTEHSTPGKIFEMARAEYPIMGKILKEAGVQAE
jgi:tripartite-type tricarboxylate transporter receptor subunit TctC